MNNPSYSVCMLCYNERDTVEASVTSVVRFAESVSGEVVVVDSESTDGSWEILQGLRREGLKVITCKCSRGAAREAAFRSSAGRIVFSHMDCDDVFSADGLRNLLLVYHSKCEGRMMMTRKTGQDERSNITIAPREIIERAGGWRDINWSEDWDLWNRVAGMGKYTYLPYPFESPPHERIRVRTERDTDALKKLLYRYQKSRDGIRMGKQVFPQHEHVSLSQKLPYWLARLAVGIRPGRFEHVPFPEFDDTAPRVT